MHDKMSGEGAASTPRRLKDAISRRSAQFAGNQQQDAHEFLADCLDELQEEMAGAVRLAKREAEEVTPEGQLNTSFRPKPATVASASASSATSAAACTASLMTGKTAATGKVAARAGDLAGCKELSDISESDLPCALNFTTEVEHCLTCTSCHHSWARSEILRHFSLDLPPNAAVNAAGPPPNIQSLLQSFFNDDQVEVQCEKCEHGREATVRHRISKLPRVLILHLKRFDSTAAGVRKRLDVVRPLQTLSLGPCCKDIVQPPPPMTPPTAAAFEILSAHRETKARPASSLAVVDGGAVPPAGGAMADAPDASDASGLGGVVACHGSGGKPGLRAALASGASPSKLPRRNLFGSRVGEVAGGGAQSGGAGGGGAGGEAENQVPPSLSCGGALSPYTSSPAPPRPTASPAASAGLHSASPLRPDPLPPYSLGGSRSRPADGASPSVPEKRALYHAPLESAQRPKQLRLGFGTVSGGAGIGGPHGAHRATGRGDGRGAGGGGHGMGIDQQRRTWPRRPQQEEEEEAQMAAAIAASLASAEADQERRQRKEATGDTSCGPFVGHPGGASGGSFYPMARSGGGARVDLISEAADCEGGELILAEEQDEEEQIRLAMEMSLAEAEQRQREQDGEDEAGEDEAAHTHAAATVPATVPVTVPAAAPTAAATALASTVAAPPPLTVPNDTSTIDLSSDSPDVPSADAGVGSAVHHPEAIDVDAATPVVDANLVDVDLEPGKAYKLCATVWHSGTHASSGHYIADVRRSKLPTSSSRARPVDGADAGWQRYDDSFVRPVAADAPEAATKGYIFFYVHDSFVAS